VELTAQQAASIAVSAAQVHPFQEQEEVVGRIAFETDAALLQAQSSLMSAASAADFTSRELARVQALAGDSGGVPQREIEQATADARTAQANLLGARAALRAAGEPEPEIDRLMSNPQSAKGLGRGLWAVAQVPESMINRIHVDQPVEVSVPAYPGQMFRARVARINGTVDEDTHHLTVRCRLAAPAGTLRPGMLAELRIAVGPEVHAVAVPAEAIVREADGSMLVWVTQDHRHFVGRPVRTGVSSQGYSQVVEGIQAGELVVSKGGVFLSNLATLPAES
jgi:cobalt-zinc-cadmium efflux system membrane fusion protein